MFSLKLKGLRFDVTVEDAVSVHVFDSLENLVSLLLNLRLWDVVLSPVNGVIEIAVHELEDKCEASRGLVVQHLVKANNVRMRC